MRSPVPSALPFSRRLTLRSWRRTLPLWGVLGAAWMLAAGNRWDQRDKTDYSYDTQVKVRPVALSTTDPAQRMVGALTFVEGWQLISTHRHFVGLSGMTLTAPRRFLFASDLGALIDLRLPEAASDVTFNWWPLPLSPKGTDMKVGGDIEAVSRDPVTGDLWLATEMYASLRRLSPDGKAITATVRDPALRAWPKNRGAESLAILPDRDGQGQRWIVIGEGDGHPSLMFLGSPADQGARKPVSFRYDPEGKGRPTDIATLPDGRLLILHRDFNLFGAFTSIIAIADPSDLREGAVLRSTTLATLAAPLVAENFEGIALDAGPPDQPGTVTFWIVSDDNVNAWQRTLLLRFRVALDVLPKAPKVTAS